VKTCEQLLSWCVAARREFGDASVPVCQCFFAWQEIELARAAAFSSYRGFPLEAYLRTSGARAGDVVLRLAPDADIEIPVRSGEPEINEEGVVSFGAEEITRGVWALRPSLNMPDFLHAFVVLYGVPDPAPWERRIVVPA
jgi:hypothetical protein